MAVAWLTKKMKREVVTMVTSQAEPANSQTCHLVMVVA
jgi:hypothetical protein